VPPPVAVKSIDVVVHVSTVVAGAVMAATGEINCAATLNELLAADVHEPLSAVTV
jgi:hypothetical protein